MTTEGVQSLNRVGSASKLKVVEVDPRTDPRWEAFVKNRSDSLIYHHPVWLQVLEEAFHYQPVNLACEDSDGQLQGIFPLFETRHMRSLHEWPSRAIHKLFLSVKIAVQFVFSI